MEKVYIEADHNVCNNRLLDGDKILNYLIENNYLIVNDPKKADTILIITCAVRKAAADLSLKRIKKLKKYNAELIVGGCLPAIEKKRLSEIFNGKTILAKDFGDIEKIFPGNQKKYCHVKKNNYLLPVNKKIRLNKIITKSKFLFILYKKLKSHILGNIYDKRSFIHSEFNSSSIFYLRVSSGCLGNCSYCAIKKAAGNLVSKTIEECVEEFKNGLKRGFNNFIITGDDVGAYGVDISTTFPILLKNLIKIPGDYKIIIHSLNPGWMVKYTKELMDIISSQKIIEIHVPIQSANQRILKLMNRYSNIKKIGDSFNLLKKSFPNLRIVIHYLCGFPTETQEEVNDTLNFIIKNKLIGFILSFSSRPDTIADKLKEKLTDKQISKRLTYSKKILTNNGYNVLYFRIFSFIIFDHRTYL